MNYPGIQIKPVRSIKDTAIISIPNVVEAFDRIPLRGDYIPIKSHKDLIDSDTYNSLSKDDVIDFAKNPKRKRHFQGIVRTKDGKHIIFSGGDNDKHDKSSQLFICSVDSHTLIPGNNNERGLIGMNLFFDSKKNPNKLKNIYVIKGKELWHCGGITLHDHILLAPIEGDGKNSEIRFIDVSNPKVPKDLGDNVAIVRKKSKAGTASMIRLPNNKYLCLVFVDSDKDKKRKFDFYLSKTTQLKDGFDVRNMKQISYGATGKGGNHPRYQSIQLLLQSNNDIFVIGTQNTNGLSPIPPSAGKNRSRLYKFSFHQDISKLDFKLKIPQITIIRDTDAKTFEKGGTRYNFNAAAGVYITTENDLAVYACHHRLSKDDQNLQCTEFYPNFRNTEITSLRDSLIEIYDDKDFKDRCLRIRGGQSSTIINYTLTSVDGKQFDEKASSIRFQLPKGKVYELYEDAGFEGKKIVLTGTGKLQEIRDLDQPRFNQFCKVPAKFSAKVSSSRFI